MVSGQEARGTVRQEVLSEHQEVFFHCAGAGALARTAQRGKVSLLGDL